MVVHGSFLDLTPATYHTFKGSQVYNSLKLYSLLIAFHFVLLTSCSARIATVQVTVVDESGKPIESVDVAVGFSPVPPSRQGVSGKGLTNSVGIFSFTGEGYIGFTAVANKIGYYESRVEGFINDYRAEGGGRPIDPKVTLVLRPIRNPVKMYARREIDLRLPQPKEEIGFDLLEWAWCAPYGSGKIKDLIFKIDGYYKEFANADGTLTVSFSNPDDGIQQVDVDKFKESMFPWPYEAPEGGYRASISWRKAIIPQPDPYKQFESIDETAGNKGYVFRIRTRRDAQGRIVSAHYGKLEGAPNFGGAVAGSWIRPKAIAINPTLNDRNLETKMGESSYPNLKTEELPREPWIGQL